MASHNDELEYNLCIEEFNHEPEDIDDYNLSIQEYGNDKQYVIDILNYYDKRIEEEEDDRHKRYLEILKGVIEIASIEPPFICKLRKDIIKKEEDLIEFIKTNQNSKYSIQVTVGSVYHCANKYEYMRNILYEDMAESESESESEFEVEPIYKYYSNKYTKVLEKIVLKNFLEKHGKVSQSKEDDEKYLQCIILKEVALYLPEEE